MQQILRCAAKQLSIDQELLRANATTPQSALDGARFIDLRTEAWPIAQDFQIFGITQVARFRFP